MDNEYDRSGYRMISSKEFWASSQRRNTREEQNREPTWPYSTQSQSYFHISPEHSSSFPYEDSQDGRDSIEDSDDEDDLLAGAPGAEDHHHLLLQETQERLLPFANVWKVMKTQLPQEAKVCQISDVTKTLMQECASEFVSFVSSEAAELSQKRGNRLLTCEDLLDAFRTLGFDDFVDPLREYTDLCRHVLDISKRARRRQNGFGDDTQPRKKSSHSQTQGTVDASTAYDSDAVVERDNRLEDY